MGDLSDFQKGQIDGARMAGGTVAETAQLLGISRDTVSKVMTAREKYSKNSSAKHKSGRSSSLSEMERRTLTRIVSIDHKTTSGKIKTELNEHLDRSVLTKKIRWEWHKSGFYGRTAIKKPLLTQTKVAEHLKWCKRHKGRSLEQWKDVIFLTNHLSHYFQL